MDKGYNQTLFTKTALQDPVLKEQIIEKKSQRCAKVDINEKIVEIYSSYQEAARKNNLQGMASHLRKVCKGEFSSINKLIFRDIDINGNVVSKPIKSYKAQKKIIAINIENPLEELFFDSISEAAKMLNSDRGSIQKCIKGENKYSVVKGYILRELDLQGNIIINNIDINK